MKRLQKAFIISGEICSGKSTLADAVAKKMGIKAASFGGFVKSHCITNGIEPTRKNLQDVGEIFIHEDASGFLARVIDHSIAESNVLIFEGVRHKIIRDEIAYITELLRTIYIDTDEATRYVRYKSKHNEPTLTIKEFIEKCNHPVEKEIKLLRNSSDIVLDGKLTIEEILYVLQFKGII